MMCLRIGLLTLWLFVSGCGPTGPELASVKGVLMGEEGPIGDASITFYPENGQPSYGQTNSQGRFELAYGGESSGAVVGKHTVKVLVGSPGPPPPGQSGGGRRSPAASSLPSEFTLPNQVVVESGDNDLTLQVDS